jgi:dihydropteroate synthase
MGIVNVTPDSFSDGGEHAQTESAIAHGRALAAAGASILDVGGESTRPYSEPTPEDVELARAAPVIEELASGGAIVSIDTRKPAVMRAAAAAGAAILNDVAALDYSPESLPTARDLGLPVVLMHAQGDPKTMQVDPRYDDVALDIFDWLEARLSACEAAGIPRDRLIADPGVGFGKTHAQNLELLASLTLFHGLGVPLLVGASRKGFIGKLTGEPEAGRRVVGSVGAAIAAAMQGVQILRVHDVAETASALAVWHAAMVTQSMDLDGRFTRRVLGSYGP